MATESVIPKTLPAVCPRLIVWKDDSVEELSHSEAALIGFMRCLPDDLRPHFKKVFDEHDKPFADRLEAFMAKALSRRDEVVAAGWTWWT